jgi:hypothetical protein
MSDAQRRGGDDYGYRLRISRPRAGFSLRVTPSSLFSPPGGTVPITVYALRRDGFDGDIHVALKDPPAAFRLHGGVIAAGRNSMRMTLTAPPRAPAEATGLHIEGRAQVAGKTIRATARPADNVMQAFLYRHLVPAAELLYVVRKQKWPLPAMKLAAAGPIVITPGSTTAVRIRTRRRKGLDLFRLRLDSPPEGLSVGGRIKRVADGLEFEIKASEGIKSTGARQNLIVQVLRGFTPKKKDGKPAKKRYWPVIFLPAIPIEIKARP